MAEKINTLNFSHLFILTLILFSFAIYNDKKVVGFIQMGQLLVCYIRVRLH